MNNTRCSKHGADFKNGIYSGVYFVSAPSVFYYPQLQTICCYIARYYVRK